MALKISFVLAWALMNASFAAEVQSSGKQLVRRAMQIAADSKEMGEVEATSDKMQTVLNELHGEFLGKFEEIDKKVQEQDKVIADLRAMVEKMKNDNQEDEDDLHEDEDGLDEDEEVAAINEGSERRMATDASWTQKNSYKCGFRRRSWKNSGTSGLSGSNNWDKCKNYCNANSGCAAVTFKNSKCYLYQGSSSNHACVLTRSSGVYTWIK